MCLFRKKIEKKEEPYKKIVSGRNFYDVLCDEMEKKKVDCENCPNNANRVGKDFHNSIAKNDKEHSAQ